MLRVEDVRIERVQDITPEDCFAEGAIGATINSPIDSVGEFMKLWDKINAKRGFGWRTNPWIWVIEFSAVSNLG